MSIVLPWFAAVFAMPAGAEPAPAFAELLRQAESSAPRLRESLANVDAAQGLAKQAGAFPNPVVGVLSENFGGGGSFNNFSRAQTTWSVSEVVELGGKRSTRIAAGEADLDVARAVHQQARADFAFDLAVTYATAEVTQARAALSAEELSRAEADLDAARKLVDAGKEADLRAVQAQAAVTGAHADLEAARADAAEALTRLSSLVGVAEPYTAIGPSLLNAANPVAVPSAEPPQVAPVVLAAEAGRDAAARRLDLERKRAISDVSVFLGSRRLADEDVHTLVAGVSVPLPLFDRNRGAVGARRAELAAANARLEAARLEVNANWRAAMAQSRAAANRVKASDEAEAAAREAYRLVRIGYEGGRSPLLEVLATRRSLSEAQLRALDARLARIRAEATLARLAGRIPFGG